jgi:hypothetical protein
MVPMSAEEVERLQAAAVLLIRMIDKDHECVETCLAIADRFNEASEERSEIERLREALRFYAQQRGLGSVLASDGGAKARAALGEDG